MGKSGVKQKKVVDDPQIIQVLKLAIEGKSPSERILCDGDDCLIRARHVNSYLKPFDITAKDLRGLHANEEMRGHLQDIRKKGKELPHPRKERDKVLKAEFKDALALVAVAVGHQASTLRSQYLVPGLEKAYMKDGTVIEDLAKQAAHLNVMRVFDSGSWACWGNPLSSKQSLIGASSGWRGHLTFLRGWSPRVTSGR